ncbi:MAG TPA: glycoside hydrolase family 28 protein [Gemmatimonadaceae bacterium]|nr:glycoside hydrolase family 28 protein [Gemmatimonadaceae bacterium]
MTDRTGRQPNRREFLAELAVSAGGLLLAPTIASGCAATAARAITDSSATGWDLVPSILQRIVPPVFPSRDFPVTSFGARGDGQTDCTRAFSEAIAACTRAGGGRVVVPSGRFATGAIHLATNVNLHVESGATIAFSPDPAKYLPVVLTRFEGVEVMGYSPLIYAVDCENVAVTGRGTLDGGADNDHWWPWKGTAAFGWKTGAPNQNEARTRLFQMAEKGIAPANRLFGDGSYLRPSFIQPYLCRNVLIEGVRIVKSPMWEIHPVLSRNVTVRSVSIETHGPNNDGCNPESCRDVLIEKCFFDTGDDCIAIKSGRNADGRRLRTPSENIVVRECEMRDGHGGVTIGSEISGGVRNVFAERCRMDSPNLDRALRFKNNAARGGVIEHIYMRDVTVGQVADAVLSIDFYYEEGAKGEFTPVVRDVEMKNVTSRKSQYALYLRGLERSTIADVRVIDCKFENVAKPNVVERVSGLSLANTRINGQLASA